MTVALGTRHVLAHPSRPMHGHARAHVLFVAFFAVTSGLLACGGDVPAPAATRAATAPEPAAPAPTISLPARPAFAPAPLDVDPVAIGLGRNDPGPGAPA